MAIELGSLEKILPSFVDTKCKISDNDYKWGTLNPSFVLTTLASSPQVQAPNVIRNLQESNKNLILPQATCYMK